MKDPRSGIGGTDSRSWDGFWQNAGEGGSASWSKRRICALLARHALPGRAVLDAGSGSGFFSQWFIGQGCITHALDYSPAALEATQKATGGRCAAYYAFDLLSPGAADEHAAQFDIIFSDGLFEHFHADQQDVICRHMARMLKPGGVVITFVPNRWTPWTLIRPFLMPGIHEKPFTLAGLKRLYRRNGLTVAEAGGINVIPAALSPDALAGGMFGMLVYCIGGTA